MIWRFAYVLETGAESFKLKGHQTRKPAAWLLHSKLAKLRTANIWRKTGFVKRGLQAVLACRLYLSSNSGVDLVDETLQSP